MVRWATGPLLLCRLARLPTASGPLPAVALVVPARDEARRIRPLLGSIAALRPAPTEVVVVDDDSADATAELAAAAGATVVRAPARPPGWNGKQWACHVGQESTTAEVLCFVDADVELAADALERIVAVVEDVGGLVSVQPHHVTRSHAEGMSLLPNLVSMMAVDAFGPARGRLAPSGAFGPVLACRRSDHERAGGHAAVRGAVMEDVALAGTYRRAGLPVTLHAGGETVRFRMHDGGVRAIVTGWVRGLGDGARRARLATVAAIGLWLSGLMSAPLALVQDRPLGAVLLVAYAAQLWWLGRRIGSFRWTAWALFPINALVFTSLFLTSVGLVLLRRPVSWKGRRIAT